MFRDALAQNQGMLLVLEDPRQSAIWMKNMRFPLDIIWISADNKVADLRTNVLPCKSSDCESLYPNNPARYVLEVNAGFSQKNRIKIGDKVFFAPQP
jgi:uncharacterized membrane protein (UPF0127 family)